MAYCFTLQRFAPNLLFTSYDQKPDWKISDGLPKVSITLVPDKNSLGLIGEDSPLFSGAWNDLKAKAETERWLCIPELPDETWIKDNEAVDDLIFKRDFLKNS